MHSDHVILEGTSPYGNINCLIEDDGHSIYFSLVGPKDVIPMGETEKSWSPFRTCWVANTHPVEVSDAVDLKKIIEKAEEGQNPIMPGKYCHNPLDPPVFDPKKFEVVWFEEGDCAALLHNSEIVAVIPPWCSPSFSNTLGYSREFKGAEFLGFKPLTDILPHIQQRVDAARKFWDAWDKPDEWQKILDQNIQVLETSFGPHSKYFQIDGQTWPPRGLVVFEHDDKVIFVTIGVSILAQPRVELFLKDPSLYRRFELGIALSKEIADQVSLETIGEYISQRVCIPWDQLCWLGEGHTVDCKILPEMSDGSKVQSILFTKDQLDAPQITLPNYNGDPVNLFWAIPISSQEFEFLNENVSDKLFPLMKKEGCSWVHKNRPSAV